MDPRTFATLEFQSLIDLVAGHVQTPMGRRRLLALRPSTDPVEIERGLDLTSECVAYLEAGERFGLAGLEDPEASLARLEVEGARLEPLEILAMERLLSAGMDLRRLFPDPESRAVYPLLHRLTAGLPDLRAVLTRLRGKILPGGEISDDASPQLRAIRRESIAARSRVHRSLEAILRRESRSMQEELVTFRSGRFVIPVRTDSRGAVPGIVHGLSSSGQTTFLEPLAVIDQNNELVRLREEEEAEVARILADLTEALRERAEDVGALVAGIEALDASQAKARFAIAFGCSRPRMVPGKTLRLEDARHILLENALRAAGGRAVPVSLELDVAGTVLVISGPNAGGKTVVLKTTGLCAMMAQAGMHVPARQAVLPVFDRIFADIGDQQSIAANLSTFTAHVRNVAEMARQAGPSSLILLDEVGTGTDPDEGEALAIAIVEHFRQSGALTIATTHYNGLKMWVSRTPGVRNASVEFDEPSLRPTYRLIMGVPGVSAGLNIARRMELPESILAQAEAQIDPHHVEAGQYLRRLHAAVEAQEALQASIEAGRAEAALEREYLAGESARRERERAAEFERALAKAVRELAEQSERLAHDLKERAEAARLRKAAARGVAALRRAGEQLRPQTVPGARADAAASPSAPQPEPADFREGDRVRILPLDKEGVVESVQENGYTVTVGILRFRADRGELARTGSPPPPVAAGPNRNSLSGKALDAEFHAELNIIGLAADEALDRLDKFFDDALLAEAESVRIIHGFGKGILRRAVAQYLKGHAQVESFGQAPSNQGGGGATVVQLKKD